MTHENLLDAATYAWKATRNYDPKLGRFITTYHREETEPIYPRISLSNKTEESELESPKIKPYSLDQWADDFKN